MRIVLFQKKRKLCYSTSQVKERCSKTQKILIKKGWNYVGVFIGRGIVGYDIPTVTEILESKK